MPYNGVVSLSTQHLDTILARMRRGDSLTTIAHDLGYADHSGIAHRLDNDPEFRSALRSGIIGKLEKREQELGEATQNVTVTRADRLLGHARWWAERLDPARFGQLTKLTGADGGPIQVQVVRFGQTIEGETVSDAQHAALLPPPKG